ncbi:MAG: hypothetical protein AB7O24_26405 [Kofleriaceae bacterium]
MARNTLLVLSASAVVALLGCGGSDDRPRTAPLLPIPDQDAPCSEYDDGANGSIDTTYTYGYDDDGFMIGYVGVPGVNGTIEYNSDHFMLRYLYTSTNGAGLESEDIYTRDELGRVLTHRYTENGAVMESSTFTYDGEGRVIESVLTQMFEGESAQTTTATYEYQSSSVHPSRAEITYPASNAVITYTSSDDEHMLHGDIDDGGDGVIDRTTDQVYDDNLFMLSTIDRAGDTVTFRGVWTYDSHALLLAQIEADHEGGLDDYKYIATRDSDGMLMVSDGSSPSGKFPFSYLEVYKDACTSPSTALLTSQPLLTRRRGLDAQVVRLRALAGR